MPIDDGLPYPLIRLRDGWHVKGEVFRTAFQASDYRERLLEDEGFTEPGESNWEPLSDDLRRKDRVTTSQGIPEVHTAAKPKRTEIEELNHRIKTLNEDFHIASNRALRATNSLKQAMLANASLRIEMDEMKKNYERMRGQLSTAVKERNEYFKEIARLKLVLGMNDTIIVNRGRP